MEAVAALGDDIGVLPVGERTIGPNDDLTVGLHHFIDATLKRQRLQAQGVGRKEMLAAIHEASSLHVLADTAPPG